jgi:RNA polymerase sigma-70 factor (ECF subfamily)
VTLVSVFRRGAAGFPQIPDPGLEERLAALCAGGSARWPALALANDDFVLAVAERVKTEAELAAVHGEDLFLATACARRVRGAVETFEREFLSAGTLAGAVRKIDPAPGFVDEVRQAVREKLFVPPPGRIAEYSGRGSLGAWIRVVAVRIALDLRPRSREGPPEDDTAVAADRDPELRYLQQRYKQEFEEAAKAAFAALDDEQVNLLRLQFVDGLQTAQIAALFRVDRSTIKRRLASCRETLLERTRMNLQQSMGLSPQSFESLSRLLASQLHVSVARLLKER